MKKSWATSSVMRKPSARGEFAGVPKAKVEDATRVSKGTPIVTYISNEEEQIKEKMEKLDSKIQEAMDSRQIIFSNDAKALDAEIELYLYNNTRKISDVYAITERKNMINEKVEKKAKIVGDLSPVGSQIKSLIEERTNLEKQLNDSEKSVLANRAGLVSYRVDGYEDILTLQSLSKITSEDLGKIKMSSNQMIPIDTKHVKLINNFECYIAVFMNSKESQDAKLDDHVYLRFDHTEDALIDASIEYISEEKNGRLIVFKIKTNVEELSKYRKIDLDVVWWQDKGLKINKNAITYENIPSTVSQEGVNIPMVIVRKASYQQKVWVKIVREVKDFVIIENYTDKELLEMGISEELVEGRNTIKMYDEAVISAK